MSTWNEVGKRDKGAGAGRFVQFENDKPWRGRILDDEPFMTRVHKIGQDVRKGDKVEEVFRTIPATTNPDDSYILKHNPTRYPEQRQFHMRVHEYKIGEDGKHIADGELKILTGGNAIFKELKNLYDQNGSLTQFDIVITRKGEKRDTEYSVSASPFPLKNPINVDERKAALAQDVELRWDNVFPTITGEEQAKIIREAGLDIAYDPAASLAEKMSLDDASRVQFTFGKFKGKTIGEVMVIDSGYVSWASENVTSADTVAAACRVMIGRAAQIAAAQAPTQQALPANVSAKPSRLEQAEAAAAAEAAKPAAGNKAELVEKVSDFFEQDPRYEDITIMVNLIKKHSGGKATRVRDLTESQLASLLAEISVQ